MTHDELLKEIDRFQSLDETSIRLATAGIKTVPTLDTPTSRVLSSALRAVVELHKPIVLNEGYVEIGEEPRLTCGCDPWNEYEQGYPCPTIQAIEKELK